MHNTLTDAERSSGFRLLFDGQTTAGWRGYNVPTIYPHWRVADGVLRFEPDPKPEYGHDIVTLETFSRFELLVDWRLFPGGNSGVMYHVRELAPTPFMTGPEIQLLDDVRYGGPNNGPDRLTGACYDLYARLADAGSPLGEWNSLRLLVDGDHVEHHLNGVLVCTYDLGSEDWTGRVQASKFKQWPHFASERNGHLCLQDHLSPAEFRNIKIRSW